MNNADFYKQIDQFKSGRESVTDVQYAGQPIEVSTTTLESCVDELVQGDMQVNGLLYQTKYKVFNMNRV